MDYWDTATAELSGRDPVLSGIIRRSGTERLDGSGDPFVTLANAIVGQQISTVVAAAIWRRLNDAFPDLSPAAVAVAPEGRLRACGLSRRKVEYLYGIARAILDGTLDFSLLAAADDETVRKLLVAIRGVGPWTAEMFLIFHLRRPDILPLGDVGLLRGCQKLYRWPKEEAGPVLRQRTANLGESWRPWRTVATWYVWRDLDSSPVVY